MKKLLSLVAVVALLASIEAEARHCGKRACAVEPRCETRCPVTCPPCEQPCEMQDLPQIVECQEKPVCRTVVCTAPRKVCTRQEIVRCHWVCPPNCEQYENEQSAEAAGKGLVKTQY